MSRARSRMPLMPAPSGAAPIPLAVVADQQSHPAVGQGAQVDFDPGGAGVAGRVGEPFLGDAVEDEFGGRVQAGQAGGDVGGHAQAGGGELGRQGAQGAVQAEFLQDAGAQAAGDAADLVQAGAGGLLGLVQVVAYGLGVRGRPRA